jgi:hypothetical protein
MDRLIKCLAGALLIAWAALGSGCSSVHYGKYNVNVAMDPSMRDAGSQQLPSVTVDVLAVNENDTGLWQGKSATKWFSGLDKERQDSSGWTYSMNFNNQNPGPLMLKKNDPIWDKPEWKSATWLAVMANIPGADDQKKVLLLPRRTDMWASGTQQIDIVIQSSGLKLNTQRVTPKAD